MLKGGQYQKGNTMSSTSISLRSEEKSSEATIRKGTVILRRLFSAESNKSKRITYELYPSPNNNYTLCGKEFLSKVAELVISIVCIGIYMSKVHKLLNYTTSSLIFPGVVFSCSIIYTSVMVFGYTLGQVMPPVLTRVFNAISIILYFTLVCILFQIWVVTVEMPTNEESNTDFEYEHIFTTSILLCLVFLCAVNFILYCIDLVNSIKTALRGN